MCVYQVSVKKKKKKKQTGKSSTRILVKNVILRATLNQKGGRHIGSHDGFRSYALHNRKKKTGEAVHVFEEAQDSYGLEANQRCCPQRDNSHALRERDGEAIKCKRPTRAERMAGFLV